MIKRRGAGVKQKMGGREVESLYNHPPRAAAKGRNPRRVPPSVAGLYGLFLRRADEALERSELIEHLVHCR